jgi:hypothetical protein
MAYILTAERDRDPIQSFERYQDYLAQNRQRFPASAFDLATSDWYFDATNHRCPHDAWLEAITISEPSSGARHENRSTRITVRLLGAYHDGHIELEYPEVFSYNFDLSAASDGHGDWRFDEFRLSSDGHLLHEIEWRNPGVWLVEASDVRYRWVPTGGV